MAISVNCATKVVTVPQADLTYVSAGLYELSVENLRLWLKDWEDSEVGMAMPDTHRRNAPVTLSGTTYAQTLEIINGYTITLEPTATPWTARVVGGNHNVADVKTVNHVSLLIGNSAGLIVGGGGGGASAAEVWAYSSRTLTGNVPANIKQVNDVTITGTGVAGSDPWRPA